MLGKCKTCGLVYDEDRDEPPEDCLCVRCKAVLTTTTPRKAFEHGEARACFPALSRGADND